MLVSTIDDGNKIIIFGGRDEHNAFCRTVEIFDPETKRVKQYFRDIEFVSVFNPCMQFKTDTVVALGMNN